MNRIAFLCAAALAPALCAQGYTTLTMNAMSPNYTYSTDGNNFFDLVVHNSAGITLRGITVRTLSPAGTAGTIQFWLMNPAVATSHIGRELLPAPPAPSGDPSGWRLFGSGPAKSTGVGSYPGVCLSAFTLNFPDTFLPAGTYGVAIDHINLLHLFDAVATYPAPPGTYSDGDVEMRNGSTQAVSWTSAPLNAFSAGGNTFAGTVPRISLHYNVGVTPHACAARSEFGEGSIKRTASFWQRWETAPGASAALTGRALDMVFTGTGYVVSRVPASYVPPTAAAIPLPQVNGTAVITPSLPVLYPSAGGGSLATDLYVNSNGYISAGVQSTLTPGPLDPTLNMNAQATAWYSHHNYDLTEPGSGPIVWEEDLLNGILYVTWLGVESLPSTSANPSTVQFQFFAGGNARIVWQQVDALGNSGVFGSDWTLIGFSPAGPSPATDPFDFVNLTPFVTEEPELFPLRLTQVGDALVGGTVDLVTSNEVGLSIGLNLLSTTRFPAPLPLAPLGAPATTATWLDPNASILNLIGSLPGMSMSLTVPIANIPGLAGLEINSQSFWLDLAAPNLFTNMLCSNGAAFVLGNTVIL